ncbi:MAG: hypothetical protein COC23_02955 [Hyphomicrobiales bacterium]|nr:MAG: hypothetical protein COC23_02955 [Hyphomicrobiales bacterium]
MSKAYWIARVDVTNPDGYPEYITTAKPAFERYEAKFLVRAGRVESMEGTNRARNVIIEFPSMQHALDCYNSVEYTAAIKIRQAVADAELIIVEGV